MADSVDKLAGCHAKPKSNQEKHKRINSHPQLYGLSLGEVWSNSHFKRNRCRPRYSESGSDREINQNGKDKRKMLTHILSQAVKSVKFGNNDNAQHGENYRRGEKADHSRNQMITCILTEKRWKDKVSGSEKERKQHEAYQCHFSFC